jgi:stage II sporulation protein D
MFRGCVVLAAVFGLAFAAAQEAVAAHRPTFVVTGHGWGHGVGLAQDGAYGYAKHGLAYAKILAHYYPGTALTRTTVPLVRILLADGARSVSITSNAPFRVRDDDGKSYPLAAGTYTLGPSLKVRVEASSAPKALPGPIRFIPGRLPLELGRAYRGSILVSAKGGGLQAVNIVGLEDYVRGVVSQEVDPEWPIEALKAQAVASRSFAVATKKTSGSFDLYADTRSQVYGGVDAEQFSTNAAVQATEGKILTYKGQPAITYFSASSGGKTAAIQDGFPGSSPVPYLVSVSDPYDTLSPFHSWGPYVFGAGGFAKRLGLRGKILDARVSRNHSSRVNSVTFATSGGQRTFTGGELRDTLGLRSTWFSVGVLALDQPVKPLVYAISTAMSGIARAASGARIERLAGGNWVFAAPVDRDPDGTFTAAVKAKAPGLYRVATAKAASPPVQVAVAAYVKLDPAPSTSVLTGRARPVIRGAKVTIQRNTGSGWTSVATAALGAAGRFSAGLDVVPGSYRARYAPGHGLRAGASPVLRVVASGRARRLAFVPNDPLIGRQWYLGQIRAFDYWQQLPPLASVKVAVIDSGVDGKHPEFQDQVYAWKSFVSSSAKVDTQGHGTFVAGEIAAATNNGVGIAGIGFPVQLIVGKVVRNDGTIPLRAEANAIRWAVNQGARVINLSLAGLRDPLDARRDTYSRLEAAAIRYAVSKHVLVVAAVGNSDQAPRSPWNFAGYPAALPHVVGVSALDATGNVPEFSNRDTNYNDLSAPGTDIFSTLPLAITAPICSVRDLQGYSDCGPFEFRHAEGTSFAAPMVTAAAALMFGMRPGLRADQVASILERSAEDMDAGTGCRPCPEGHDRLSGAGRVDVAGAAGDITAGAYPRPDVREPNDDAGALASTIWRSSEGTINATTDYWDDPVDVYRIKLTKGQRIWLVLNGPAGTGTTLGLWKPGTKTVVDLSPAAQRMRLAQSAHSGSVQKISAFRAKTSGSYYIEVQMTTKSWGAYSLQYRRS